MRPRQTSANSWLRKEKAAKQSRGSATPSITTQRKGGRDSVAVTLNETAFDHAKALIDDDQVVVDERDDWSEHPPSAAEENRFIEKHGMPEYAKWQARHRRRRERGEQGQAQVPLWRLQEGAPVRDPRRGDIRF